MGVPRSYRSIEEFEREELRPSNKAGFSLDDLDARDHARTRATCSSTTRSTSTSPTRDDDRRSTPVRLRRLALRPALTGHLTRASASPCKSRSQRISPVVMELAVEVPADAVQAEVDKAYSTLAGKAHVQGFRPGKAPRARARAPVRAAGRERRRERHRQRRRCRRRSPRRTSSRSTSRRSRRGSSSRRRDLLVQGALRGPAGDRRRRSTRASSSCARRRGRDRRGGRRAARAPPPAARHARSRPSPRAPRRRATSSRSTSRSRSTAKRSRTAAGEGVQLELGSGQVLPELDAALHRQDGRRQVRRRSHVPGRAPARRSFRGKIGVVPRHAEGREGARPPRRSTTSSPRTSAASRRWSSSAPTCTRKLEKMLKDRAETALAEQIVDKLNETNPLDVPPSLVEQQCRIMEQEVAAAARAAPGQRVTQERVASAPQPGSRGRRDEGPRRPAHGRDRRRSSSSRSPTRTSRRASTSSPSETGKNVAKLRVEYRDEAEARRSSSA